jgi:hypothetical protein
VSTLAIKLREAVYAFRGRPGIQYVHTSGATGEMVFFTRANGDTKVSFITDGCVIEFNTPSLGLFSQADAEQILKANGWRPACVANASQPELT